MGIDIHLLIHNILTVISAIVFLGVAFFTFLNGPRQTANIVFACMMLAVEVFVISHGVGVNIADPEISRRILMLNVSIFFIGAFNLHAILALLKQDHEKRWIIRIAYIVAAIFTLLFFAKPELLLMASQHKMYFPNYYVPGMLNWVRVAVLYILIVPYLMWELSSAYRKSSSRLERNQLKYFMMALVGGYAIGFIPNFLIYGVAIDPLWGMSFGVIFAIPLAYGAIQYELFNIRVIAKQAFLYSVGVIAVGGLIIFLNYSSQWIHGAYPTFPLWVTPLVSSILAVTIGTLVWRRLRESDVLKYEFITTATHKFRTPLTHVKWAAENLLQTPLSEEQKTQVGYIQGANTKLVELTDVLMGVSASQSDAYDYHIERNDLNPLIRETIASCKEQATAKHITITEHLSEQLFAQFDPSRIRFILQTLIENALQYSPENGTIDIATRQHGENITVTVRDSGMGISREELPLVFSKFYRGAQAKLADTEGMGIGLYLAKGILARHSGEIWVESEGAGKGSAFSFSLPAA